MALNNHPCSECRNYDPIVKGENKTTAHGWCVAKSTYPSDEPPGKVFPVGHVKAAPGEKHRPYIVMGACIESHCSQFQEKPAKPQSTVPIKPPPVQRVPGGRLSNPRARR